MDESEWEMEGLKVELKNADVILVCYDIFNDSQKEDLINIHLAFVHLVNPQPPIVVVGTKVDIYEEHTWRHLQLQPDY